MNVYPIQSQPEGEGAKCSGCGAPVAADQRYCLACGQPCSPVRLPFLDVLQAENELRVAPIAIAAPPASAGYLPPLPQDDGAIGWLRRYSGLFGLLAVLLIAGLIGLLVGHWLAPSKAPAASVVKIEGNFPAAAAVTPTTTAPSGSSSSSGTSTSKTAAAEAKEVKEVKEAETAKAQPKPASKPSSATLKQLSSSNGKQHQKEIEKLTEGDKPIETGG